MQDVSRHFIVHGWINKKKTAADAKEMGYGKNVKGYIETRARYGSKANMKSGKGLGT